MKFVALRLAGLVAVATLPALAHAQASMPKQCPAGLSRSAVLADVEIWQSSGLAAFDSGDGASRQPSPQRSAAVSRYERAKAAPEFAARVQSIAQRRGEAIDGVCAVPAQAMS